MERRRERVVYSRIRGDTITTNPCTPTIPSFLPLPPHLPSSFSLPSRRWRFRLGFLRGGLFGLGGLKKLCLLFIILAGQSPKECFLGHLGSKTVMHVTHQVEFLHLADLILVMKDGKITESGKYADILKSGTDFMELVAAHKEALSTLDYTGTELTPENIISTQKKDCTAYGKIVEHREENKIQGDEKCAKPKPNAQLVQEEKREKGKVGLRVYWKFITMAYKGALVPLILAAQISCHVLQIGSDFWMARAAPVSKDVKPPVEGTTFIFVYVALAVGSSFCVLVRVVLLGAAGYKTATILFNKMHASTDQSAVDLKIPSKLGAFAFSVIQVAGIVAVMSQIAWQSFIVFIPVIGTCIWYQQYYISTARELARLIGVCKAPLIQHSAESISGSTTIRSFNQESRFMDINMKLIDSYLQPRFYSAGAMEWLCFRLDMLSSFTFALALIFLISVQEGTIDPAFAGLVITYGLNLNVQQAWVVYNLCNLEAKIISVERILQYSSIPSEAPLVLEARKPDNDWPSQGEINIHDLQLRYAPHMPLVLRGLTCTLRAGMRTGVVGRTGSGKSTLIQALFRLIEPAAGNIFIDNLNISAIGLHDLRSRLSIIPQDPTMFEGTVRSNLDLLEEHTDEQIWEVL